MTINFGPSNPISTFKVELRPGQSVLVTFADTDGEIETSYDHDAVRVKADLPDSTGREGVIYEETYGTLDEDGFKKAVVINGQPSEADAAAMLRESDVLDNIPIGRRGMPDK